jgi:hypothetical protein
MARASAQEVLISVDDSALPTPNQPAAPPIASLLFDDGLPAPTHAQVHYWRELCGVLTLHKGPGVADGDWPADLAPSKPTFKALVERGLLVRRGRAWHLKRDWYRRLSALRQRAVPTPPLAPAERPGPGLPSYAELEGYEHVCRWLDAQPGRRARLPFVGLSALSADNETKTERATGSETETPIALLAGMRKYRLVRHTASCEWALSPVWRDRLRALWMGIERTYRERFAPPTAPTEPCSVAAGIDTWYLNRIDKGGLPVTLREQLDERQAQANEEDAEVDTPWLFDGVPLRMYRAGVSARQGGGVSWAYILRNPSLTLLIRRSPLGGIVAQARLGSECLWRLTPRRTLDELDALVRRMWARPLRFDRDRKQHEDEKPRWQVSQVHLAHDVANAPLDREQLDRYVSRSRHQAIYEAAQEDLVRLMYDLEREDSSARELTDLHLPPVIDWDRHYADGGAPSWWDADGCLAASGDGRNEVDAELSSAEERASTVYTWGRRLSGVTFSPGGAISFVLYDKLQQGRLTGKRHMEPIWAANGWKEGEPVTRHEARLRRDGLRGLALVDTGAQGGGEVSVAPQPSPIPDDPWQFLAYLADVFGLVVGRPNACPDAVNVAWIRRVVPDEGDANRSRWPTDPVWCVVQAPTFVDAPAQARRLIRRTQHATDVERLDKGLRGYLVSRTAYRHPDMTKWELSQAMHEVYDTLERELGQIGTDFADLVRERRRDRGLPVPAAAKVLPSRLLPPEIQVAAEVATGDAAFYNEPPTRGEATEQQRAEWRIRLAERRMREAHLLLEEAEIRGDRGVILEELEAAFHVEVTAHMAACEKGRGHTGRSVSVVADTSTLHTTGE